MVRTPLLRGQGGRAGRVDREDGVVACRAAPGLLAAARGGQRETGEGEDQGGGRRGHGEA